MTRKRKKFLPKKWSGQVPPRKKRKSWRRPTPIWEVPISERLVARPHPISDKIVKFLLGIFATDVGGALLTRLYEDKTRIPKKFFKRDSRLFDYALEAIRFFVLLFGAQYVKVVKNDDKEGFIAKEAFETLDERFDFFKKTGMLTDEKHWVTTPDNRILKGVACIEHRINFLVDDKAQVGMHLPWETFFVWFGNEAREPQKFRNTVLKRAMEGKKRFQFKNVMDWRAVVAVVLSFYPDWKECLEGRPTAEWDEIVELAKKLEVW